MGAFLALTSAVCYGIVDFAGGMLSRRAHFTAVTLLGQLGGLLLALAAALLVPAGAVRPADLLWGALSGVGSGAAMHFLNRGLSRGAMSTVVPVSAVTSVALSVLCGVLLLGDRPGALAWTGFAVTVPALWLVADDRGGPRPSDGERHRKGPVDKAATGLDAGTARRPQRTGSPPRPGPARGVSDGLLASAGVAVQYLALGQAGASSGLWPVVAGRVAAVLVLLPVAARHRRELRLPARRCVQALLVGAGAALGLSLYLLAAQRQLLAVAVVLASLYPALPVVLGFVLLREPLTGRRAIGLAGAAAATVLLTLG
ncbi:EamA family transporter [Streptomyces sp. DT2A-34]|uniref:EamA family transporter n=1 Tax=Streptomyces sp. DT2A-34 TaxID=3051182 RepID=UPI00265BD2B1|nr:EamA family transporter [Streptomyces sp. DT2A-34]MDO0909516.1 EamA family transporter [Streptomyces sp. DT2A-34]